jgi:hypothetical protein
MKLAGLHLKLIKWLLLCLLSCLDREFNSQFAIVKMQLLLDAKTVDRLLSFLLYEVKLLNYTSMLIYTCKFIGSRNINRMGCLIGCANYGLIKVAKKHQVYYGEY